LKELAQRRVQLRMALAQETRPLEEGLRDNREEFRRVGGAIDIEHRRSARLRGGAQRLEFLFHHARPGEILASRGEGRRAVGAVVLEIELMSELMQDEILAIRRIEAALPCHIPSEDKGSHVPFRVPKEILTALFPDIAADITIAGHSVTRWVNQNGG
jgi:hypothetical protein